MPKGTLQKNVPLAEFTSWRIGGVAKQVYQPTDLADLAEFLQQLPKDEPLLWLGLGSNTLIRDGGFDGTVIVLFAKLNQLELRAENTVYAQAGLGCAAVARFAARQSLGGIEFLAGIPGTIGGALRMNAGCFNGETWDWLQSVDCIDRHGVIKTIARDQFSYGYRNVVCPADCWFVGATFTLKPTEKAQALATIRELLDRRSQTQPTGDHSCGSVFRNPEGDYAARLIESSGLKGFRIGGAEVSTKHANFIINREQASAADIEALIEHVAATVYDKFAIQLQREVHIVGNKS